VRFAIHVRPGSRRDHVGGRHGDALVVAVRARAVDGAANAAVVDVLAAALGVHRRDVAIVGGQRSRAKVVEVVGVDPALLDELRAAGA
jgi:uncharacterized protein (TIGR00251 family)